jgi:hypothetical protein
LLTKLITGGFTNRQSWRANVVRSSVQSIDQKEKKRKNLTKNRLPFRLGWFDSTSHIASAHTTPSSYSTGINLTIFFSSFSKIERKHERREAAKKPQLTNSGRGPTLRLVRFKKETNSLAFFFVS